MLRSLLVLKETNLVNFYSEEEVKICALILRPMIHFVVISVLRERRGRGAWPSVAFAMRMLSLKARYSRKESEV